jgi:hypothetical protein
VALSSHDRDPRQHLARSGRRKGQAEVVADSGANLLGVAVALLNAFLALGLARLRQVLRPSAAAATSPSPPLVRSLPVALPYETPAIELLAPRGVSRGTEPPRAPDLLREFELVLETHLDRRDRRQRWVNLAIAGITFALTIAAEEILRWWGR